MKRGNAVRAQAKRLRIGIEYLWAILRISLGLIFLWAFFDKLLGLGFATCRLESGEVQILCEKAWISGGSPTYGFLTYAVRGPFMSFFNSLAGQTWVDVVFMLGLVGVGLALVLGILIYIASLSGSIMLFLMWLAVFPPKNNPLVDDHIVYIFVLVLLAVIHQGKRLGFGKKWSHLSFVKKYPWVE